MGAASAGIAYNAQFKVSRDTGITLPPALNDQHRYFAIGPELNLPVMGAPNPLLLTVRYLFDFNNRVATQGNTLFIALTLVQPTGTHAAENGNGK
jgi:hypothetical protein